MEGRPGTPIPSNMFDCSAERIKDILRDAISELKQPVKRHIEFDSMKEAPLSLQAELHIYWEHQRRLIEAKEQMLSTFVCCDEMRKWCNGNDITLRQAMNRLEMKKLEFENVMMDINHHLKDFEKKAGYRIEDFIKNVIDTPQPNKNA